jgi:uncharacterized membrane protein
LWDLKGEDAAGKPKRAMLPVLTVLFLISYGLMAMLVVEQGRTIDSQRNLIRLLFTDSVQLSSIRGKANQKQQAEAQARAEAQAQPQVKSPTAQVKPHGSEPQAAVPAKPQADAKNHGTSKLKRPQPQKPPRDTSDEGDDRRSLFSI